ncbi:MAG: hypothetical protein D6760_06515 [Deltaproteobacteria bacterium]|nr:MAG: hypothetical protein D6760_06515 [Deltaproteobacteria bacterium]
MFSFHRFASAAWIGPGVDLRTQAVYEHRRELATARMVRRRATISRLALLGFAAVSMPVAWEA